MKSSWLRLVCERGPLLSIEKYFDMSPEAIVSSFASIWSSTYERSIAAVPMPETSSPRVSISTVTPVILVRSEMRFHRSNRVWFIAGRV